VPVVIPWLIFAVVVVPLAVLGFWAMRGRTRAGEHPGAEDAVARERTEREFAEAEAFEEQWREENRGHHRDRLP
jgi:hypothetical protein